MRFINLPQVSFVIIIIIIIFVINNNLIIVAFIFQKIHKAS